MNKSCENCQYCDNFDRVCLNGKSPNAFEFTFDTKLCNQYDNNDLILRGDALKAIRQRCISEHLPFKSNTPVGARVLDALAAVYQVKPYKDICGRWISVEDRLPKPHTEVLAFRRGIMYFAWYDNEIGKWLSDEWGLLDAVTHWMPLPEPPEVTP